MVTSKTMLCMCWIIAQLVNLSNAFWDFPWNFEYQIAPYVLHIQAWACHASKCETMWQLNKFYVFLPNHINNLLQHKFLPLHEKIVSFLACLQSLAMNHSLFFNLFLKNSTCLRLSCFWNESHLGAWSLSFYSFSK
jgi:hypothetical protein